MNDRISAMASFEIPRQQKEEDDQSNKSEIMQFIASQQLLDLHKIKRNHREVVKSMKRFVVALIIVWFRKPI